MNASPAAQEASVAGSVGRATSIPNTRLVEVAANPVARMSPCWTGTSPAGSVTVFGGVNGAAAFDWAPAAGTDATHNTAVAIPTDIPSLTSSPPQPVPTTLPAALSVRG